MPAKHLLIHGCATKPRREEESEDVAIVAHSMGCIASYDGL